MKILVLNYRDRLHPMAGGAEVHLHRIFAHLVEWGHEIHLLTTSFAGAAEFETVDGIQVERFGSDLSFIYLVYGRLRRRIREFNPDLIVEDINKLPFYSFLVSRKPKFLLFHHLWMGSIFKEASLPIALMVWLHEQALRFFYTQYPSTAVSPSTLTELKQLGFKDRLLHLVYNGTEKEWFEQSPLPVTQKPKQFFWLGRMRKYKGVWVALEAMKILAQTHPEIRLVMAGSGPEKSRMEEFVLQNHLSAQVQIVGRVENEVKSQYLRESLATVQSSFKEGWGLTVIEAAACGTPTLASRVAGLRDSVVDGQTGLLFKAGDAEELAQRMIELCENLAFTAELSQKALLHAQSFSWEKSARQTEELFKNHLGLDSSKDRA